MTTMVNEIQVNWSSFKTTIQDKNLNIQYVELGDTQYRVLAIDGSIFWYCDLLESADIADFEANFKTDANKNVLPRNVITDFNNPNELAQVNSGRLLVSGIPISFPYKTAQNNTAVSIDNGTTYDIFVDNNLGYLHWFAIKVHDKEWTIKLEVDGQVNCLWDVEQLKNEFAAKDFANMLPIGFTREGGREVIMFNPKYPLKYNTSLKVQITRNDTPSRNFESYLLGYSNDN